MSDSLAILNKRSFTTAGIVLYIVTATDHSLIYAFLSPDPWPLIPIFNFFQKKFDFH